MFVGNCRWSATGLHFVSFYRLSIPGEYQFAESAVTNTGSVTRYLPIKSGVFVEEESGACGMDTVAIKSYPR